MKILLKIAMKGLGDTKESPHHTLKTAGWTIYAPALSFLGYKLAVVVPPGQSCTRCWASSPLCPLYSQPLALS